MLLLIVLFSLVGGVLSLIGGLVLLTKKSWSHETMLTLISFAAGVLLAVAFTDLLPGAIDLAAEMGIEARTVFGWSLAAIAGFFLFERSFFWFHHHHGPHEYHPDPVVAMVWIGDTLHNFLDGLVITASFLTSVPLGIATSVAVAAHEVPQEVADFTLFLSKGLAKRKVLWLNVASSLATPLGAVLAFFFWRILGPWQAHLLAFTAGMFIYIAGSDLIPELHREYHKHRAWLHSSAFIIGILLTLGLGQLLY